MIPTIGAIKLCDLDNSTIIIQRMYNQKLESGLSAKTIENIHDVLHKAIKKAMAVKYIRANPTEDCDLPKVKQKEINPLDLPEVKRFFSQIEGSRMEYLLKVSTLTGMRIGEILALQWANVDFEHSKIFVNKQLIKPRTKGSKRRFATPKNGKSRDIHVAPQVMSILKCRRKQQNEQRLLAGDIWDNGGFNDIVFTSPTGQPFTYEQVVRDFKKAIAACGIEERRLHDLRHTYATLCIYAGDDVKTLQHNLGHQSAAFTLDKYGHIIDSMKMSSKTRMETLIDNMVSSTY